MSKINKDNYNVYIQTTNILEFKTLIETLRDVLHEANITFVRDQSNDKKKSDEKVEHGGIRIMTIDNTKCVLIYVKLHANEFNCFHVRSKEYNAGIELSHLYKYIKTIKEGVLTISVLENDEQYINFKLQNESQKSTNEYKLKLMDLNNKVFNIDSQNFEMRVTMKCSEFHKLCRDMAQISERIEIICTNKKISFKCQGDAASNIRTFENCTDKESKGVKIANISQNGETQIVQGIFELKYLIMFNKCMNFCDEIQLFLKNTFPMFITYTVATLGVMRVGFIPTDPNADLIDIDTLLEDEE